MSETLDILPAPAAAERMDRRLVWLRTPMRSRWLELGEVLVEMQESLAYRTLGFKNFQSYPADRLEVSPRWAMYLIKPARRMRDFDIDPKDLVRLDISKCLEAFRLDDARMVRELAEQAHATKLTLSEIRQTVVQRALGIRPISSDEVVKKLWAFPLDQWLVVERARQPHSGEVQARRLPWDSSSHTPRCCSWPLSDTATPPLCDGSCGSTAMTCASSAATG